ncbi:hypothetical protein HAX54_024236 [Datura stramonium]|uniref:Uncharacterized protein n=1 Tax=Datura stramonium TaxID=4076 RepID=A0ABS8UZU7_DATST|nr:hypothetical protein [Datura stramonium]
MDNGIRSSEGVDGFFSNLTNAVPEIDEAVSFAEMLKMTAEEKIGQMIQIDKIAATIEIMKDYYIGNIFKSVY